MNESQLVRDYWERFKTISGVNDNQFGEAYQFGDSEAMANELADLVNKGVKAATTSAAELYEPDDPVPTVGNYDIILDANGKPVCVTRTEVVETIPYEQVSAEHAYHEGEGDRSLTYWRNVHEDFFKREYREEGKEFNRQVPCICEVFKVVYR